MKPSTTPSAAAPTEGGESGAPATIGYTSEQSLWRAATIAADLSEAPDVIAPDEGASAALTEAERRYQIQELLGVGGMGEVRLCRDEAIGREIALKTLLAASSGHSGSKKRFLREAQVQGQLEHPSVVPVYDLGVTAEGQLFFTMRRVRGHTLAEVLRSLERGEAIHGSSYTRRKLLESFVRVCLAVDYAHTRGVLHRDLKPANIMVGSFGEVYVLDWGIAKLVADHATGVPVVVPDPQAANKESVAGTPGYMSPEQLLGLAANQDARTDVYSLGAILYEILTLRPLHSGRLPEITEATLRGVDARPSAVAPDVPPELDAVCVAATALDRQKRTGSARELAAAVERYLDGDRDLELRRELAELHVKRAREALDRARGHDGSSARARVDAAEAARAEATREVIQALALDPKETEARRLLVQLLVDVPEHLPESLEAEIADATQKARAHTARFTVFALGGWAATIPFVAQLGVLDWISFGIASALTVLSAMYAFWLLRRGSVSMRNVLAMATLVSATCGALSCWLGPFVLAPVAGASVTIWVTFQTGPRERWLLMLISGLGMFVPFLLEFLGLVPRSFSFADGNLILHPRALAIPPLGTTICLVYSTVTFTILQPVLLGGLRDALNAAERKLYLQSWRLRQLAPEPGAKAGAAS